MGVAIVGYLLSNTLVTARSYSVTGLVLKRSNSGEADRIITMLTETDGKLVGVAKNVRSLKSSQRAALEPGNLVQVYCIKTAGLPIYTQTKLLSSALGSKPSLTMIRKLVQLLEILDKLCVEGNTDDETYTHAIAIRNAITRGQETNQQITARLGVLIELFGYPHPKETQFTSIIDYVQDLTDKKMHSFDYLSVPK